MGKLTLITGGVRSGKSKLAVEFAQKSGKNVAFIATCAPLDTEMKRRIALHQKSRPGNWTTIEEPLNIEKAVLKIPPKSSSVIIDCITLLVSNHALAGHTEEKILKIIDNSIKIIKKSRFDAFIVSNEVGMGIVPENKLARDFRDIAGKVNQMIASKSDEVYFMVSGLPLKMKGN